MHVCSHCVEERAEFEIFVNRILQKSHKFHFCNMSCLTSLPENVDLHEATSASSFICDMHFLSLFPHRICSTLHKLCVQCVCEFCMHVWLHENSLCVYSATDLLLEELALNSPGSNGVLENRGSDSAEKEVETKPPHYEVTPHHNFILFFSVTVEMLGSSPHDQILIFVSWLAQLDVVSCWIV